MQDGSGPERAVDSRIAGLRGMSPEARLAAVADACGLDNDRSGALAGRGALSETTANGMIENVVGVFEMPLGIAANFRVNGQDYLVPMAVEEPSVVAAASYMAKIARGAGGFEASATEPVMRAQVQVLDVADRHAARARLLASEAELMAAADARDPVLVELGGGCRGIEVHLHQHPAVGAMLVVHLLVDVRDAMGANAVNSMAEALAPRIAGIAGGRARLRILSNLADLRLVRASVTLPASALDATDLDGSDVAQGMVEACALAEVDPYRAATHNKGIMNGIDPVVLATGNDWRAIEAGAHARAARDGRYGSLSRWERTADGGLSGSMELPMAVGLVGGATRTHPTARAAIAMLGIRTATELGHVIAAVGLAQNMGALRALATEGIQKGHMALHARNISITAGATGAEIDRIAARLADAGDVSLGRARALLAED